MGLMVWLVLMNSKTEADGVLGFAVERTKDGIQEVFIKPRFYEGQCSRKQWGRHAVIDTYSGNAIDVQLKVIRTS